MKIVVFVNALGLGGTEKAACRWARGLKERGHSIVVLALGDGPRRMELESAGVETRTVEPSAASISRYLREIQPDVIHTHAPGVPHPGDVLGDALATLPKIPVVQTNIFGRFDNPREDRWTDFRLFISWTSCVQAARRSLLPLDKTFLRRASVAVYPLDPDEEPNTEDIAHFRHEHGVREDEILFGRLSRPEPNKWTNLPLAAFRRAQRRNPRIKLLLREPPSLICDQIATASDRDRFVVLTATSDPCELRRTMASLDVVLHTSSIGESFGYGIAEPMNLGKPVITNSTPWGDQAQVELVRHGECGLIASTEATMAEAILTFASDSALRARMGRQARENIQRIADPNKSLDRLENALGAVITGQDNSRYAEDLIEMQAAAAYLDQHQFGHPIGERCFLHSFYWRVQFYKWRQRVRRWFGSKIRL